MSWLVRSGFVLGFGLGGCGTQFADPIREHAAGVDAGEPNSEPPCLSQTLSFDGASFATADRLIGDDFSIEAWLKTTTSQGNNFSSGSALVFADVETVMVNDFATAIGGDKFLLSTGGPDTQAVGTSKLTTDQWLHVAATRSKATGIMLVYVNGVLEASAVGNKNSLVDAPTITIGGRSARNFYTGLLAEVRLWSLVRSQSELVANMHHRLDGNEAGLVGYYRMDEGGGATLQDSSASGNDAALTGSASYVESDPPLCASDAP